MINKRISNIKKTFTDYFEENSISLIEPYIVDKVEIFDLIGTGWHIQYKLFFIENELVLDFFAHHRMTNSRHHRIHEDGTREPLNSFWEFGFPFYQNDPEKTEIEKQKIINRNELVQIELKMKGFII
jgi:hypothetical protein